MPNTTMVTLVSNHSHPSTSHADPALEMQLAQHCLDNLREMVYWVDTTGKLHYVNRQMCELLGFSREELLGTTLPLLRADFNETRWQYQWDELRKGKILEMEVQFRCKDQSDIPVQLTGYFLKYQEKELVCVLGKDLRADKRREEMLRLTRYSLNHTQEMVYWIRQDGSFYYFNDAFANRLGYSREEMQQKRLLDLFPMFNADNFQNGWRRLHREEIISQEMQIAHRNGFLIPVQTYITLISIEGETCACGILSDISERKRKEEELKQTFQNIRQLQVQLATDNQLLRKEIATAYPFNQLVSTAPAYKKVLKQVEQAAATDATVLLYGEPGSGKQLLAHTLHQLSRRAARPLVKVDCTVENVWLLESDLFGHEQGAFPGAYRQKPGLFERLEGGTLFLYEVGALPLPLQAKLLHVLQEGTFERLGGTQTFTTNVRVIAATSRDLAQLVDQQQFRLDLYYRLHLRSIHNLPLRARRADIPLLAQHFVQKYARKMGKPALPIALEELQQLRQYPFPGNVRELENLIERTVLLCNPTATVLPPILSQNLDTAAPFKTLEQLQRDHILNALQRAKGQVSGENGAAKLLGMNDKTLYSKLQKLGWARTAPPADTDLTVLE